MKSSTCDICGSAIREGTGAPLYDRYQVDNMVDVCEDCAKPLNAAHQRITIIANDLRDDWFRRFLRAYKAKRSGAVVDVHKF